MGGAAMLNPQYLERVPDRLVDLYAQVETDILCDMAKRISAMGDFIPSAQWQYRKLIEMGNLRKDVVRRLAAITGESESHIQDLIREAGLETLDFDDEIYRAAGKEPAPLTSSPELRQVLNEGLRATKGLFENLTRTTASTATRQFEQALDRAWLQVSTGAFSYQDAVRIAVRDLAKEGVGARAYPPTIRYPSGHIDKLDVAVRRAVLTGVNQTALRLQEARMDEMECDLVEVSAHAGARVGDGLEDPGNHAWWQGKVYSRSGHSSKYPNFVECTGYGTGEGLGGWNCRHSFFPYYEGVSRPAYTEKELEDLNGPMYTYRGKNLTEYEATQRQREMERQIRRWKREKAALEAVGQDSSDAAAKLAKANKRLRDFLAETGLKHRYSSERVEKPVQDAADASKNSFTKTFFNDKANYHIEVPGYSKRVNDGLSAACERVAKLGSSDRLEHLELVDLRTGQSAHTEVGDETSVGYSYRQVLAENPGVTYAFVHNHNTDGQLSERDLETLLQVEQIRVMIAVRNDGVIYVAPKDEGAALHTLARIYYQDDPQLQEYYRLRREGTLKDPFNLITEALMVNNMLRDFVKGYFEHDGRP